MRYLTAIFALILVLTGCEQQEKVSMRTGNDIPGLATPIRLGLGSSSIYLTDYFPDVSVIDSVFVGEKKINLPENKIRIFYRPPRDMQPMKVMDIYAGEMIYSIPLFKSNKREVKLTFDPQGENFREVEVVGEFNGWVSSRNGMEFTDNAWSTSLYLEPGVYQYRLVIDGVWMTDPGNPDSVSNNAGAYNSVITVETVAGAPKLMTREYDSKKIRLSLTGEADSVLVLWKNQRMPSESIKIVPGELEIPLPLATGDSSDSFIRVWAWNTSGISNEVLIPLRQGKVISDPGMLNRTDMHAAILYNVFVDRFYNGDTLNDIPVEDPSILPPANYHGGDINGVMQKIGYLEELGVNSMWISPIVENPETAYGLWPEPETKFSGYHGYWPVSFTRIDHRFGTEEDFRDLVEEVHAADMNILLDFVANHVHEDHPVFKEHPDWATDLYLPDGSLNTERWDEYRLTTWFDVFLPTLNLEKPQVTDMLSDSAVWWIETYGLDGFRHDATKHIPEIFWRTLTMKLKERVVMPEHRSVYQIGETYGSAQLIGGYVSSGMLDGQFDFNVYDAAIGVFGREEDPFTRLDSKLKESFAYYGEHNLMGYITGNQDRARFISYAGGDLGWGEDAKLAGWTRDIGVGDTLGYDRLAMLMAFNMTIPGIPVIYYGDEFGMPGGNDPDNRRMMRFADELTAREKQNLAVTKELIKLRKEHLSLIYGDFIDLQAADKTYAYGRKYFGETALIFFNKDEFPRTLRIELPAEIGGKVTGAYFVSDHGMDGRLLNVSLDPWSFGVVILEKK